MAKTPVALVSADWHVRRADRIWYRRDEIHGDTGYSVSQVSDIADDYDVPSVFLAGDLFDMKLQQSDALRTMRLALDEFQEQHRHVFYIQGQHERSSPTLLSALHPWPNYIHKMTIERSGYSIYGLDYCNPSEVEAELRAVPAGTDILVTHQVWKDFLGDKHGDAWFDWAAHANTIITGDYHRALTQQHQNKKIISPGSLCMQDIGETPIKSVCIVFDDLSTETVRLRTRNYYEATLNTDEELERFLDNWQDHPARVPQANVPPNISTNLLRVRYRADLPQAKRRLEAAVGLSVHLFTDAVRPQVAEQITVEQERRLQAVMAGGLEGCITEFYSDNPRVRDHAIRLARTTNISAELLAIYKEIIDGNDSCREGPLQNTPQ